MKTAYGEFVNLSNELLLEQHDINLFLKRLHIC